MGKRCTVKKAGAFCALILSLALLPLLPGGIAAARADVNVSGGDYSAYALSSTRENRTLSFTLSDLPKGSQLSDVTVTAVTGAGAGQAITPKDYAFDDRKSQLVITDNNGFLGKLNIGQYRLTMIFAPAATAVANFYVFATDTIQFLTEPETIVTNIGDDVTFECRATATAAYTYQWQRRSRTGWKNIRGATARKMTISAVPESLQGYVFRCVVATTFASAASNEAKLYMIGAGDESPLGLYGLGCLLAAGGLIGCLLWRRKRSACEIPGGR